MSNGIYVMDDVDLPDDKGGPKSKYPFETMKIGQSFFLPEKKASKFSPYAAKFGRRFGHKYVCRDVAMTPVEHNGKQVGWKVAQPGDDEAVMGCAVKRVAGESATDKPETEQPKPEQPKPEQAAAPAATQTKAPAQAASGKK